MTITRKSLADTIDEYDAEIASLQESKRETFQAYRDQVTELSGKDAAKAEIEAAKKAIRRRQAATKKGAEVVDAADALADEVFEEITASRAPRAMRVEKIEEFDAETGEIKSEAGRTRSESASGAAPDSAPNNSPETATSGHVSGNGTPSVLTSSVKQADPTVGASQGGDHESVIDSRLETEGEADEPTPNLIDDEHTVSEEAAPGISASDVEPVAPDPRAFIKQLRPHCQNPDACGGQGKSHCFSCSVKIKDDPLEAA